MPLNYRHAFHAGNFADLAKHAILLQLLSRMCADGPLSVLDAHAGAGVYALDGDAALRSGEAEGGIGRLMAVEAPPAAFAPLIAAVQDLNRGAGLRQYPGSPALIVGALGPGDRYLGCELRHDDFALLARHVGRIAAKRKVAATVIQRDGYDEAVAFVRAARRGLVLIDPPYERPDDYERAGSILKAAADRHSVATAIWAPLKDLETFDAFLRRLERDGLGQVTVAQLRLRALTDPMRMNGCAMILVNAPDMDAQTRAICGWIASELGEIGAGSEVFRL